MVGLVENNVPILGIVYVPMLDVTYYAEKGKGAYKIENGVTTEIKCSNVNLFEDFRAIVSRHHFSDEDKKMALFDGEPTYPDAKHLVVSVYNNIVNDEAWFGWSAKTRSFEKIL